MLSNVCPLLRCRVVGKTKPVFIVEYCDASQQDNGRTQVGSSEALSCHQRPWCCSSLLLHMVSGSRLCAPRL